MNPDIMREAGFQDVVDAKEKGKCPHCLKVVPTWRPDCFKDLLSLKEFRILGTCQECQDEFYGEALK